MSKLLTMKDTKTGKRYVFNPMFIGCICEHYSIDGAICVNIIASDDDSTFVLNYPYDDAMKRWQEAINT